MPCESHSGSAFTSSGTASILRCGATARTARKIAGKYPISPSSDSAIRARRLETAGSKPTTPIERPVDAGDGVAESRGTG